MLLKDRMLGEAERMESRKTLTEYERCHKQHSCGSGEDRLPR